MKNETRINELRAMMAKEQGIIDAAEDKIQILKTDMRLMRRKIATTKSIMQLLQNALDEQEL